MLESTSLTIYGERITRDTAGSKPGYGFVDARRILCWRMQILMSYSTLI